MGDTELYETFLKLADDEMELREKLEAEKNIKPLNEYARDSELNKDFIVRLFNLNVPYMFLGIFTDRDLDLKDKEIWEKVRKSNVLQIEEPQEIYKIRARQIGRKNG
jgi:hypothetical protein